MALQMWECPCGRRVPGHVDTCRCGQPRPAAPPPPAVPSRSPENATASLFQSTGLRAVGTVVAVVAVYFGSRACNRSVTSRDVRQQAEEVLAGEIGAENAKMAMNRYHAACFDETYRTGWGRRQASKFDEQKYVDCLTNRLTKDRQLAQSTAPGRMPVPARPVAVRTPQGPPASVPLPTGAPPPTVSDGRPRMELHRLRCDRAAGTYEAEIALIGGPQPPLIFTNEHVICDGVPLWAQAGHRQFSQGFRGLPHLGLVAGTARFPVDARRCLLEVALANERMQPFTSSLEIVLF